MSGDKGVVRVGKLQLTYRIILRDKNGNIIRDSGERPSHSFTKQFLKILMGTVGDRSNLATIDITNTSRNIIFAGGSNNNVQIHAWQFMDIMADDDVGDYGIVVGTDNTAPTVDDYKLAVKINHGVGFGQLDHGAVGLSKPDIIGNNVDMIANRDFYNGSGNTITIKEMGFYCKTAYERDILAIFCIVRDILADYNVPYQTTATIQYTWRTSYLV